MKPSLQKLFNIFKLEVEHEYDNRAVIGGLDRIIDTWDAEARTDELSEELINAIGSNLRNYPRLSTSSRADVLEGLWHRLQKECGLSTVIEFTRVTIPTQTSEKHHKTVESQVSHPLSSKVEEPTVEEPRLSKQPITREIDEAVVLDAPVTVLPGVGPRHANTLNRLGIHTLRDMLDYYPRRYDDYTQLKPINRLRYGDEVTVIGTLKSVTHRRLRDGKAQLVEAILSDGTGALRATWFHQPWIIKRLQVGKQYALSGKIDQYLGRLTLNNPEPEPLDQQLLSSNRIVPVYPLTEQITQRWVRKLMNQVVTYWAPRTLDYLPKNIRRSIGLIDLPTALLQVHYPDSGERLKDARTRLAFDEIFLLQLGVLQQKHAWQDRSARIFGVNDEWLNNQWTKLPFQLTKAQQRILEEARRDLSSGRPMNRLLQGDVGSGKTIVATLITAMVTQHGAQVALMAPTSILAEQHFRNLQKILTNHSKSNETYGVNIAEEQTHQQFVQEKTLPLLRENEICLLLGATSENEKATIRDGLANGRIKLVIGTHALIEDPVVFADLGLVIIDEQHRFGVEQRAALRAKGYNPHLLVMTATPIPRSLALTVYGDLDLSVIDEMPPGRQSVDTHVITPLERERAYNLIRKQVDQGGQAFIIYPLVEESEKSEVLSAVEEHNRLQKEIFPNYRLGLLHGRLKQEEKDKIMEKFQAGEYQILVSTSVVEVGVDIPNATVMVIEGANRFGLAQLHQFRGRVGRSAAKSYCLLIPDNANSFENERLQVMVTTDDGFILAERDLEQRGPGEFLGTRQAGFSELKFAKLTDVHLIERARQHAQVLFDQDPGLIQPENQALNTELARFWGKPKGDIS
jgi:ATP-dependent DNA helicase RecG